ncbi:stage II sporulation protein E [Coprobacillus sp. AF34-1BH]|mgnify:FL=1|uniref:SpoIIE family protein phosphatase n=1 Tax=Faecalibacillus faecis TaxID=1982628 RepID=UPI000E4DC45A|nr:SpoIIE family protein phosphatase [Faecalibacillus faecis]RHP25337.1 stage II sporulation protein E [Coprobacillus sp. AF34-1BH]
MDLVIQNKQKRMHYILPLTLLMITMIFYYSKIQGTSLPFTLPLFIVAFGSGTFYFIGYLSIISFLSILQQDFFTLTVFITVALTFLLLNVTHLLKTKYLPIVISLILLPFLYANHYNLIQISFLTLLTFFNGIIDQNIIPLLIHQNKNVITIQRLQSLILIICTLFIAFIPYNTTYTMIFIRYFLLLSIYYLSIEKVMPIILYLSIIFVFISPTLKDEVLSLILPMGCFFMIQPKNKYLFISFFMLCHIILPFFITYDYYYYAFVILVPVFLFMLSPQLKTQALSIDKNYKEKTYQEQLKSKAEAFSSLFNQLTQVFKEESQTTHLSEYVGYVYEDVCYNCSSKNYCFYKQEGMSRLGKLISKGIQRDLDALDFDYVYQHCLKPDEYLRSLNNHQKGYYKMMKLDHAQLHLKKDLLQEFSIMGHVFQNFSERLEDENDEKRLLEHLRAYRFEVYYLKKIKQDYQNYLLEIGLEDIDQKTIEEELIPILETYLNTTLDIVSLKKQYHHLGYVSLLLKHELKYALQISKKQYALESQNCGDSFLSFGYDEHHYVVLSDGMGQGYVAYKESKLTLDVLSQLVKNGISLKDTINTVNALLKIKNQGDMYTTLDLFDFNLMSSRLKVIKYGAYESYLIRNQRIDTLKSHSLPIGMSSRLKMLSYDMKIQENDLFVIVSDGVGEHFLSILETYKEDLEEMNIHEMASFLYQKAFSKKDLDDMTIIVVKVICRD